MSGLGPAFRRASGAETRPLTEEEFKRIDTALGYVIEQPAEFSDFAVQFAIDNANRLGHFGRRTRFSKKQLGYVAIIEQRISELETEDGLPVVRAGER